VQISRERIGGAATAAYELTKARLGAAGSAGEDCAAVTAHVARVLDEAFAAAAAAGAPLACAAGCAWCCHLRVSAFAHEAAAIVHFLRARLTPAEAAAARERIVANAARIERMTVAEHYAARMPCALLVDGRCRAYEVRPSACAAHHSLSRERCEAAFANPAQHGTPANSRPAALELQTLGDALIAATQSALVDSGLPETRGELHQQLRELLAAGDTAFDSTTGAQP
jgi:hypothetical protein